MNIKKSILTLIVGIILIVTGLYCTNFRLIPNIFSDKPFYTFEDRFNYILKFMTGIPFIILGVYILFRWKNTPDIIKWAVVFYLSSLFAFIISMKFMGWGILYGFFSVIVFIAWWCPLDMRSLDEIDVYFIVIRMFWWGVFGVISYYIYTEFKKKILKSY